jgi:hypothetical protein
MSKEIIADVLKNKELPDLKPAETNVVAVSNIIELTKPLVERVLELYLENMPEREIRRTIKNEGSDKLGLSRMQIQEIITAIRAKVAELEANE